MASGSFTGTTTNEYITAKIEWSSTATTSTNKSSVKATLYYKKSTSSTSGTYGTVSGSITINGTKTSYSKYLDLEPNNTWVSVASATVDVSHNADGSKSITISATGGISGTTFTSTSISKSVALDTIPRASSITATAANIGSATTIKISRASSSFTHTITYSFSGLTGTIATKTTSTSVSWTVPTSFYAKIPNAKTGTCTLTCQTFNGSTSIGSKTTTFTVTASESSSKPTLSPTVTDTNSVTVALTGDSSKLVKYYSTASTDSNAAARNSATLKSQKTTNGSKSVTTETGTFSNVENATFTFSATDSRGYTTTSTKTVTMVNYVKLTCNLTAQNPTTSGEMTFTVKGNYFNGSFGSVSNTLTVQYRYKVSGGSYGSWTDLTATKSGNTYTANGSLSGLDYQTTYVFQARAIDAINTSGVNSDAKTLKTTPVFDWGADDFKFNVPVYIANNKRIYYKKTDGGDYIFANLNGEDAFFGYGGYNEAIGRTYLDGNEVRIRTKSDFKLYDEPNNNTYSLLGLVKALTTGYELTATVTLGGNYTSGTASAYLVGNNLRMGVNATRNAATSVGNITNETVMTINIKHNGKIKNLYRVDFNNGTDGGASIFSAQASIVDDNNVKVTITLCATTSASSSFLCYFAMPCTINLNQYV